VVVEDGPVVVGDEVEVGTVLLEARICFDVPNNQRTTISSQAFERYTDKKSRWRQAKKEAALSKLSRRQGASGGADSEDTSGEECGPKPKRPAPVARCSIDKRMFQEIHKAFTLNPYEALQALAGTAIDRETTEKIDVFKYVVPGSVRCLSPAGLADTTAAREFASVRVLYQ
jgi:hypothetical protein